MTDDLIRRSDAIRIASGFCHPANVTKELAKLPPVQLDPCFACKHSDEDCWEMCQYCPAERRTDEPD